MQFEVSVLTPIHDSYQISSIIIWFRSGTKTDCIWMTVFGSGNSSRFACPNKLVNRDCNEKKNKRRWIWNAWNNYRILGSMLRAAPWRGTCDFLITFYSIFVRGKVPKTAIMFCFFMPFTVSYKWHINFICDSVWLWRH